MDFEQRMATKNKDLTDAIEIEWDEEESSGTFGHLEICIPTQLKIRITRDARQIMWCHLHGLPFRADHVSSNPVGLAKQLKSTTGAEAKMEVLTWIAELTDRVLVDPNKVD